MTDPVESGSWLAWRLLAALEGGALVAAGAALTAHLARNKLAGTRDHPPRAVCISNIESELGSELAKRLTSHGCVVSSLTGDATSGAGSGAVDTVIIVGAEPKDDGFEGLARIVSQDVGFNLKLLETHKSRISNGGRVLWAASNNGADSGHFSGAIKAFDDVIKTNLELMANTSNFKPVWIGRYDSVDETAERVIAALIHDGINTRMSFRTVAVKIQGYLAKLIESFS